MRQLPGAEPFDSDLARELDEALEAHPDKSGYANRLLLAASPYLRQHGHNPVNWYVWGPEAFAAAARLDRPILLSIGYSTCHWCHVMAHESFEDEAIARYLNAQYIAIKVDREERPDVDAVYMAATQLLQGGGGWPMTVFLLADKQPFFAGTYFPPRDGMRGARMGFLSLLQYLRHLYDSDRPRVARSAEDLAAQVREVVSRTAPAAKLPSPEIIGEAVRYYARRYDPEHGGLAGAPKFPSSLPLRLLQREPSRSGDSEAGQMAAFTLTAMAQGGIYDQIGGGFHRYATDAEWLVPHFEKMLYDNALLALAYLDQHELAGDGAALTTAREVLAYAEREMSDRKGGFYAASDADSPTPDGHAEEGWFFTWTPAELEAALGAKVGARVADYFGVSAAGNFEGRSVLSCDGGAPDFDLAEVRRTLYEARRQRPPPHRDDKVLTAWNGLMIAAFARAAVVTGEPRYAARAAVAADFLAAHHTRDGGLLRSSLAGVAHHPGFLDDYAFLAYGLIELFLATLEPKWLEWAMALHRTLREHFWDGHHGGFFLTSDAHERLLAREKPAFDGAEPSGNAIAMQNLARLTALTGDDDFSEQAEQAVGAFAELLGERPMGLGDMLVALDWVQRPLACVVIVKPEAGSDTTALRRAANWGPWPAVTLEVVAGPRAEALTGLVPHLAGKTAVGNHPTAYVCQRQRCLLPAATPAELGERLRLIGREGARVGRP